MSIIKLSAKPKGFDHKTTYYVAYPTAYIRYYRCSYFSAQQPPLKKDNSDLSVLFKRVHLYPVQLKPVGCAVPLFEVWEVQSTAGDFAALEGENTALNPPLCAGR